MFASRKAPFEAAGLQREVGDPKAKPWRIDQKAGARALTGSVAGTFVDAFGERDRFAPSAPLQRSLPD